jgi:DNA-binding Lrp family transcriptional regulator
MNKFIANPSTAAAEIPSVQTPTRHGHGAGRHGAPSSIPTFDETDRRLASRVQACVDLVAQPFATIAAELEMDENEVLTRLQRWSHEGTLREISAVLEGSALGHDSALVAGQVPAARIEEVANIINGHPMVTHNYERTHAYNLWFTIAAPGHLAVDHHVRALERATGIERFEVLRRTHTFKIGVNFDVSAQRNNTARRELIALPNLVPTRQEQACLRALQRPLPLERFPFETLARLENLDANDILAVGKRFLGTGMRKYVATLNHRKIGIQGNGMVVWNVPESELDTIGARMTNAPEVSHCYARNPVRGFPYRFYSMLHAKDTETCRTIAQRIAGELGLADYLVLFSTREFKKCRLRYFLPELDQWWERNGQGSLVQGA